MAPHSDMTRFEAETTVGRALELHPAAQWVFASYRLSGCWNCASSPEETLAEVAAGYGFPLEKFLRDLNSLFDS
jgi:hybrid cluster-associated redox disulfide protein